MSDPSPSEAFGPLSSPFDAQPVPDDERAALLTLLKGREVGPARVRRAVEQFGSARMALSADDATLERVGGFTPDAVRSIREVQGEQFGERELEAARRLGIRVVVPGDEEYPDLLARIHNPPMVLYVLGKQLPAHGRAMAVVGSRRATEAGKEVAHQIGAGLSRAGVSVVSGMAYGIDAASHRGSLQEGGNTVAVLGSGVDVVYPPKHRGLYDELVRHATVVSEFSLGVSPEAHHFPMRNRIIAGLSVGTVVVEAAARSGSLITAQIALEENRQVFAVPGHPLSRQYEGCNYLLRQGAGPVRHAGDLLEDLAPALGLTLGPAGSGTLELAELPEELDADERAVVEALDRVEGTHADTLAERLKLDASRLGVILMGLEMKGLVQRMPGDHYRRRNGR